MDMTGKSQDEVVAILRNTKRGSTVMLCVSRVETAGDSTSNLPRQMVSIQSSPMYLLTQCYLGVGLASTCHHLPASLVRNSLMALFVCI